MKDSLKQKQPDRLDRQLATAHDDPYRPKKKLPEPTLCPQCGLVYHSGHWQQAAKPQQANEHLCPACHRIKDRFPAGYVTLQGEFLASHREELLKLARSTEEKEKGEHPLQRIMDISEAEGKISITTTDIHVARRIGEAIERAYEGDLKVHYGPEDYVIRVSWAR